MKKKKRKARGNGKRADFCSLMIQVYRYSLYTQIYGETRESLVIGKDD